MRTGAPMARGRRRLAQTPRVAARLPCAARDRRGPRKLASLKHARPSSRLPLRCSAAPIRDPAPAPRHRGTGVPHPLSFTPCAARTGFGRRWSPVRGAGRARPCASPRSAGRGEARLPKDRRASCTDSSQLFERSERSERSEFCDASPGRASQGSPRRGPTHRGVPGPRRAPGGPSNARSKARCHAALRKLLTSSTVPR